MHSVELANEAAGTKCLPSNEYIESLITQPIGPIKKLRCAPGMLKRTNGSLANQESLPVQQ